MLNFLRHFLMLLNKNLKRNLIIILGYHSIPEMTHKIRSRPEKRVGGGGYGNYKAMNKFDDKKRKFKQIDRNHSNKKFER